MSFTREICQLVTVRHSEKQSHWEFDIPCLHFIITKLVCASNFSGLLFNMHTTVSGIAEIRQSILLSCDDSQHLMIDVILVVMALVESEI